MRIARLLSVFMGCVLIDAPEIAQQVAMPYPRDNMSGTVTDANEKVSLPSPNIPNLLLHK